MSSCVDYRLRGKEFAGFDGNSRVARNDDFIKPPKVFRCRRESGVTREAATFRKPTGKNLGPESPRRGQLLIGVLRRVELRPFGTMIVGTKTILRVFSSNRRAKEFADKPATSGMRVLGHRRESPVQGFGFKFGIGERTQAMRPSACVMSRVRFQVRCGRACIEAEIRREERKGDFDLEFGRKAGFLAFSAASRYGKELKGGGCPAGADCCVCVMEVPGPPAALIFSIKKSSRRLSRSSPPRRVLPFVASTWKTPVVKVRG